MNQAIPEALKHEMETSDDVLSVSLMEEPLHTEQAGMPVLQLLAALRRYDHERNLSHQERYGTPDPQSSQALSELQETQRSLQALTSGKDGSEADILIEASLNLRMAPRAT
ncbi:MAG: hypothetical protein ACPG1A_03205 [Halioglobus sp.]